MSSAHGRSRSRLDERVLDAVKEVRTRIEIRKSYGPQFEALVGQVRVDEFTDSAFSEVCSVNVGTPARTWPGTLFIGLSTKIFKSEYS